MTNQVCSLLIITLAILLTSCSIQIQTGRQVGYRQSLVSPLANLAMLKTYRTARVSTEDRNNNLDFRRLAGGETYKLAELQGPGEVTHIWMTISSSDPDHLTNLILRVYYNGNNFPSVEAPVGNFFGLGHGKMYYFNNAVQAIGTNRGLNSFWPMPFAKSFTLTITNESELPTGALYYYVDWRELGAFPRGAGYFHAQYRQAFPCPDKQPYLILDTEGGRGHYVGVNLSVHTQVTGWWGEGDDIFTIDGERRPSLWGTGSEDYFCGAWCYGDTFFNDYFGMPYREKDDQSADNYWNVYRYHIENPVVFNNSLKVEIEHGAAGFDNTRKDGRNNDYCSVAYWYMEKPVPLKGKLPPAEERISRYRPPWIPPGVFEAHDCDIVTTSAEVKARVQDMAVFSTGDKKWFLDDHLFCRPNLQGSQVDLSFEIEEQHQADMVIQMTQAPDYGIVSIMLDDDVIIPEFNGYAEKVKPVLIRVRTVDLSPGKHILVIKTIGKDERSSGYFWGMDYFRIGGEPLDIEGLTETILVQDLTGAEKPDQLQ